MYQTRLKNKIFIDGDFLDEVFLMERQKEMLVV